MQKIMNAINKIKVSQKIIVSMCAIVIIGGLSGCGDDKNPNDDTIADVEQGGTSIYLVAIDGTSLDDSLDVPTIGCDDKLVAVQIDKKLSPQEALETLFAYDEYDEEDGLYNIFSLSPNLQIEKMVIANDFAIVTLTEDLVTGGMCDDPRVSAQIRKTLMQFDEIDGVDIFVGDEEVNSYLSEKGSDE
ncbi:MAG: GerMN domain-containing protein [Patescibacteria group bacterium]|nr:GerMN domain-containing protein [Patescibacteria group bacterium]